jgi:hypothetical protein
MSDLITRARQSRGRRPGRCMAIVISMTVFAYLVTVGAAGSQALEQARHDALSSRTISSSTTSLREHATLKITVNRGSSIEATGQATGTLNGVLSLRAVVSSAERLTAYVVGRSRAGTLSSVGKAKFGVSGNSLVYKGTMAITHGTGVYSRASGSGIHIEGVMNRQKQTMTVVISGQIHG